MYDNRYVNRLADIYLERLVTVGYDEAKDWLYRTLATDFDLLEYVLAALDARSKIKGVMLK